MGKHSLTSESVSTYARYIGRVGALAVALGVGAAVASGANLGTARADDTAPTENAPAVDTPPASEAGSESVPAEPESEPIPTVPAEDQTDPPGADDAADDDNHDDDEQTSDETPSGDENVVDDEEAEAADDILDSGDDDETAAEPADSGGDPSPIRERFPTMVNTTPAARFAAGDDNTTFSSAPQKSAQSTPDPAPPRALVATQRLAPDAATFTAATRTLAPSTQATASAGDLPGAFVDVMTTVVAAFLSPFIGSGPNAPAEPPLLWAVLEFFRREVARTFFNRTPHAVEDVVTTGEDAAKTFDVLGNDSDEDELRVVGVTQPDHGEVTINEDGTLTYTPDANFTGTETFSYTVSDSAARAHLHGFFGFFGRGHSDTTTVTVTVTPANDAPVARNDAATTNQDTGVDIAVLANDTDAENSPLTPSLVNGPAHGTVVLNPNKTYTYTPAQGYSGSDSFTYKVNDGALDSNTATVNITVKAVTPVNHDPVAVDNTYTMTQGQTLTVPTPGLLANDTDADGDTLTAAYVGGVVNGSVGVNGDGGFDYTPSAGFVGIEDFTYQISDGKGGTDTATVTITVNPASTENRDPVATDDIYHVDQDGTLVIAAPGVLDNDNDADGDTLTATYNFDIDHGSIGVGADGSFEYTPSAGFSGTDTFTYTVSDGNGGTDIGTVTINVEAASNDLLANDDTYSYNLPGGIAVPAPGVLDNDTNNDGGPLPTGATAQLVDGPEHAAGFTLNSDGSFSYTAETGFTGPDTFTYRINTGTTNSQTATVTINVNPPITDNGLLANDDTYSYNLPGSIAVQAPGVLDNDYSDPDGGALPTGATAQLVDGPEHAAGFTLNSDGSFSYTAETGFTGPDTFTYRINTGTTNSQTATVTITVNPEVTNTAPEFAEVAYEEDGLDSVTGIVTGHVTATDADDDTLTYHLDSGPDPKLGTVELDATTGVWVYTPTAQARFDAYGQPARAVQFTVTVSDGQETDTTTAAAGITPSLATAVRLGDGVEAVGAPVIREDGTTYQTGVTVLPGVDKFRTTVVVFRPDATPVTFTLDGQPIGEVVLGPDGTAYQTVQQGHRYAVDVTTTVLMISPDATESNADVVLNGKASAPVLIGPDGSVYQVTDNGRPATDGTQTTVAIISPTGVRSPNVVVDGGPGEFQQPIVFGPDGTPYLTTFVRSLAAGTRTATVTKLTPGVTNPSPIFSTDGMPVGGLVFAPDGKAFQTVSTSTGTAVVDIATDAVLLTSEGDPSSIPVVFAPDGTAYLGTFTSDGLGNLERTLTFKRPGEAQMAISRPMSYSGPVQIAPDGQAYMYVTTYATATAPAATAVIVVPTTGAATVYDYPGTGHGIVMNGLAYVITYDAQNLMTNVTPVGVSGGPHISGLGQPRGFVFGPDLTSYLTTELDQGPGVRPLTRLTWFTLNGGGGSDFDGRPIGDVLIGPDGSAYQVIDRSNPADGTRNTGVVIIRPTGIVDGIPELRGEPTAGPVMGDDGVIYQRARMYIPEEGIFEHVVWVLPVAGPTPPEEPEIPPV